jgi:hypothetical protein
VTKDGRRKDAVRRRVRCVEAVVGEVLLVVDEEEATLADNAKSNGVDSVSSGNIVSGHGHLTERCLRALS